jgi:hypothetical protein
MLATAKINVVLRIGRIVLERYGTYLTVLREYYDGLDRQ